MSSEGKRWTNRQLRAIEGCLHTLNPQLREVVMEALAEVERLERERDDARAAEAEMRESLDLPEGQRLHYGIRQVQEATKGAVRERDEARAEVERLRERLGPAGIKFLEWLLAEARHERDEAQAEVERQDERLTGALHKADRLCGGGLRESEIATEDLSDYLTRIREVLRAALADEEAS